MGPEYMADTGHRCASCTPRPVLVSRGSTPTCLLLWSAVPKPPCPLPSRPCRQPSFSFTHNLLRTHACLFRLAFRRVAQRLQQEISRRRRRLQLRRPRQIATIALSHRPRRLAIIASTLPNPLLPPSSGVVNPPAPLDRYRAISSPVNSRQAIFWRPRSSSAAEVEDLASCEH